LVRFGTVGYGVSPFSITKEETMLANIIAEARKRQQCKELERALLTQFGEEIEGWFMPVYGFDADGAVEARLTHNGVQVVVWHDSDGIWYVEGEALDFDQSDPDQASDALLVAIDDLAPAKVEQVTEA
jgi:hypothetical protein